MVLGDRDMNVMNKEKRRCAAALVLAVSVAAPVVVLYCREFRPDPPCEHRDLSSGSPEFREAARQLEYLRRNGFDRFREEYVHPKCRENPMLKYALERLARSEGCRVDAADAFGKRIVRIIVVTESGGRDVAYSAFLLSRGEDRLLWETTKALPGRKGGCRGREPVVCPGPPFRCVMAIRFQTWSIPGVSRAFPHGVPARCPHRPAG